MQIYLARNSVQAGPYTLEQLNNMLASKEVALDDLMWHEGMTEWQKIGTVTNNQYSYNPYSNNSSSQQSNEQKPNRVTVDELFGREPSKTKDNPDLAEIEKLINQEGVQKKIIRIGYPNTALNSKYELGSIFSRMLAMLLDQLFFFICLVPILVNADNDVAEAIKNQDIATMQKFMETLPQSATIMVAAMILGLLFLQVILLITRGQSLGKLLTGLRILDHKTNRIPNITNILLIRTIFTNILYSLPVMGNIVLMVDAIFMVTDKEKRSLHDKAAGTYVVKAEAEQINKTTKNDEPQNS